MKFLHSIRTRLTLWYALWLAATLMVTGVTSYILTRDALIQNVDRSLRSEVNWVNDFIEPKAKRVKLKRSALRELRELRETAAQTESAETDTAARASEEIDAIWREIYQHTLLSPRRHIIQILDRNGDVLYRSQAPGEKNIEYDEMPYKWVKLVTIDDEHGADLRLAVTQNDYVKIYVAYPLQTVNEVLDSLFFSFRVFAPLAFLISVVGGWFLAHRSLRPVDNITSTVRDITAQNLNRRLPPVRADDELGRLTRQFNDMISRLQESFDRIQQFSVDASHELRTPLTIMRGEIEVALRGPGLSDDGVALLSSLRDEIVRLSSIVENLTALAGSDMGRYSFASHPVDLGGLVEQAGADASLLARGRDLTVTRNVHPGITVTGDAQRLRQMLLNLVDNAVKFTPDGGTISLACATSNGHAVVRVADTGPGIPEPDRTRVFERFYRVPRPADGDASGSGIGLSIARWIAEAHNGSIDATPNEPAGSVFTVRLPLSGDGAGARS